MKTINKSIQKWNIASVGQNFIKHYAWEARVVLTPSTRTKEVGTLFSAHLTLPHSYPPTKEEFDDQKNPRKGCFWRLLMHIFNLRKGKGRIYQTPFRSILDLYRYRFF